MIPRSPNHRHELGKFLNDIGLLGSFVEVGAGYGGFAKIVLEQWQGAHWILVDVWRQQDPAIYRESTNTEVPWDTWFGQCLDLAKIDQRVSLLRMLSVDAARLFADECLDGVYIDANHAYDAVLADLKAWWPKVKSGGLFAGHDFATRYANGEFIEVEAALKAWAGPRAYSLTNCSSWWMRKP